MIRDINDYVTTCKMCQTAKSTHEVIKSPLTLRDPAPGPFHTLFIDTVGPLPRTQGGYHHIVCVTDQYSRYITAWPSTDVTAKSIARKFYEKIICVHGAPKRLLSDNGSAFISALFKELCECFNVTQVLGSSYCPQSQGQVERSQRSIITLMRTFVNTKQTNWDKWLPSLVWALNTSDNHPLGYSSFLLVYGRLPVFPTEVTLPDTLAMPGTARDQLVDILDKQRIASEFAEEHLKTQQQQMKAHHDKTSTTNPIQKGDAVFIYQPKIKVRKTKKKLQCNYHGPYIVVDYSTPTTVVLKRLSDGKFLTKSVNVRRLKKGHIRANVTNWDPIPDVDEDDDLSEDDLPDSSFADDNDEEEDVQSDDDTPPSVSRSSASNTLANPPSNSTSPSSGTPTVTQTPSTSPRRSPRTRAQVSPKTSSPTSKDPLPGTTKRPRGRPKKDTSTPATPVIQTHATKPKNKTATATHGKTTPRAMKNDGTWHEVKVLGAKPMRGCPPGNNKYNVQFPTGQTMWLTKSRVNDTVKDIAAPFLSK